MSQPDRGGIFYSPTDQPRPKPAPAPARPKPLEIAGLTAEIKRLRRTVSNLVGSMCENREECHYPNCDCGKNRGQQTNSNGIEESITE